MQNSSGLIKERFFFFKFDSESVFHRWFLTEESNRKWVRHYLNEMLNNKICAIFLTVPWPGDIKIDKCSIENVWDHC